jgi:nicotinamidase-related amidase
MIRTAGELRMPVMVTEHNPARIGPTVPELKKLLAGAPVHAKDIFSCFAEPAIADAVAALGAVKNILIFGCETHICVLQTALDALGRGYGVHVAADGVGSRSEIDWQCGLERIRGAGAVVSTSEMMAYELLGRSDTPAFKALLPAFKEWTSRDAD